MMWPFQVLIFSGLTCLTLLVVYLLFLAVVYLFIKRQSTVTPLCKCTRFVFVVPAHNEEIGIASTVHSLLSVRYPISLFDVVVVADNCTDNTAERAREVGAICIERHDSSQLGKGYALRHAFNRLLSENYDAVVVVDADSIISENFLEALDARFQKGEQVIQAFYGMSNPDSSILTYLFQVGNLIENKLFWEAKQLIGLPIILRGNGMCFATQILKAYPWNAFSIVEDTEYGLMLIYSGIRIHFASDIGVFATQPETMQQAFAQRVRWASGNATITKSRALLLIKEGITNANGALFDFGLSLIVCSRPMLLLSNLLLIVLSYVSESDLFLVWSCLLLLAQVLYIFFGVFLNGISVLKIFRLVASPFYLGWLCMISLLGLVGFRNNLWVRTERQ